MKRIVWLLLTLSLPAWATINGVDSSRVVLPSFDGTRYGMYVAGDLPAGVTGQLYANTFDDNHENTADDDRDGIDGTYYNIGLFGDQHDIDHDPPSASWTGVKCGSSARVWDGNLANGTALPDYSIVADPADAENDVLRYYMDATAKGYNTECADTLRHRILLSWASHIDNDPLGGDGFRIVPDVEYWIGYRFRTHCTVDGSGSAAVLLQTPMSNSVGEPVIYLRKNCTNLDISPERYKTSTVWGGGGTTEHRVNNAVSFTKDAWHCLVTRWIKKPYAVGGATSYNPAAVDGGTRAGIFEVYLDGVLQPGSATFQYPAYTGTDRGGRVKTVDGATVTEFNALFRTGIYYTTEVGAAGSSMTVYQDDLTIAEGAGNAESGNPASCPAVQVCDASHTGNCVVDWKTL